jgi:hypothetical protein
MMTGLKWKKYVMIAVILSVVMLSHLASASELADSIKATKDGSVVVAVHPYVTDREKFKLPKGMRFVVPVGVLIQNRSAETIGVEKIEIVESNRHGVWTSDISPYIQRPFGALMENRAILGDAMSMQNDVCEGKCRGDEMVHMNEIFYAPWIEPGASAFGIVYLEARKKRVYPERIWSVDDLVFEIPIVRKDFTRGYLVNVSLVGDRELEAAADKAAADDTKGGKEPFEKVYVGPAGEKPTNAKIYAVTKGIDECAKKAIGGIKLKRANVYGYYDVVKVTLDKNARYLSHETATSGVEALDKAADKVAGKLKSCEVPNPADGNALGKTGAYYKYSIALGDSVAYRMDEDKRDVGHKAND